MIPMMPTMPDSGAISGKPDDASPISAATPKSTYTTSVVEIRDAEGAAGGAGVSLIVQTLSWLGFFGLRNRAGEPGRGLNRDSAGRPCAHHKRRRRHRTTSDRRQDRTRYLRRYDCRSR